MFRLNKIGVAAASAGAAAAVVLGGSALAQAADNTPSPTTTSSSTNGGDGRAAPHTHTAVTGDELAKVTTAVTAKDSAVTVTKVEKDPDGSYDVMGTKAGAQVTYDVSADLKTITAR